MMFHGLVLSIDLFRCLSSIQILDILFRLVLLFCFFSAFTFNPSLFSMNLVMECITLVAAALLPTNIRQSSAYLVNLSLLASSSLSSLSSIMLLSSGDRFPPWEFLFHFFHIRLCSLFPLLDIF